MKKLTAILLVAFMLMGRVATAENYRIAYVDVPKVITVADAAKKARELLEQKRGSKQREVDSIESELRQMKDELESKQGMMKADAREALSEKIRKRYREYQRIVEDINVAIDAENNRWTKKITDALKDVVTEVGEANQYSLIFGKGQVLYHSPAIDITDEVLKRLNQRTASWF